MKKNYIRMLNSPNIRYYQLRQLKPKYTAILFSCLANQFRMSHTDIASHSRSKM